MLEEQYSPCGIWGGNSKKHMSKKKYGNKLPPFVALTWEMLNSKAYKELNYASAKALPYFLGKFKGGYHDPQRYLSGFSFSYAEANKYMFSSATFSKIIQELVAKGFIDPVDKGGLRSDGKSYNLFRLSRRWEKYGAEGFETKNWRCFIPKTRLKTTLESETYSFKKGNETTSKGKVFSQFKAVEGISA